MEQCPVIHLLLESSEVLGGSRGLRGRRQILVATIGGVLLVAELTVERHGCAGEEAPSLHSNVIGMNRDDKAVLEIIARAHPAGNALHLYEVRIAEGD